MDQQRAEPTLTAAPRPDNKGDSGMTPADILEKRNLLNCLDSV
jgi:hypothetical protein